MARTEPTGRQIKDGSIQRADLDITTVGSAVAAKLIAGTGISLSSTGADAGTGDVTISTTGTGARSLPFPGGFSPGASVAGGWKKVLSSGTVTNGPSVVTTRLFFDQSTDQHWFWGFIVPPDYVSGGTFRMKWGADVTSGNAILKAAVAPDIDGTTDTDTFSFNAVTASSATAVPGTSGVTADMQISPSVTNVTANRLIVVMLGRDADAGGDTAAGNVWITSASFEYVSS